MQLKWKKVIGPHGVPIYAAEGRGYWVENCHMNGWWRYGGVTVDPPCGLTNSFRSAKAICQAHEESLDT